MVFVGTINEFNSDVEAQTTDYELYKNDDFTGFTIRITSFPNGNVMGKNLFIRFYNENPDIEGTLPYFSVSTEKKKIDLLLFIQILNNTILK